MDNEEIRINIGKMDKNTSDTSNKNDDNDDDINIIYEDFRKNFDNKNNATQKKYIDASIDEYLTRREKIEKAKEREKFNAYYFDGAIDVNQYNNDNNNDDNININNVYIDNHISRYNLRNTVNRNRVVNNKPIKMEWIISYNADK